jgi:hypothetical protein
MSRNVLRRARAVTAVLCAFLAAAPSNAAENSPRAITLPPSSTRPSAVPDAEAIARAQRLVHEVFANDYARPERESRRLLARRMADQAASTLDDAAVRFVLLSESRDISAAAGDAATAVRAIRQLARTFAVDPLPMTVAAMSTARNAADSPQLLAALAQCSMVAVDDAIAADDYPAAARLASLAEQSAAAAREVGLVLQARQKSRELTAIKDQFDRCQAARQALAGKPDDPDANLTLGRFLCFIKADWPVGLPHLARCSDPSLRSLAEKEAAVATPESRFDLAGEWWDIAQRQNGLAQRNIISHSALAYRQAIPQLSGLKRSLAESRLRQADDQAMAAMGLASGLVAELFRGIDFATLARVRIDPQIDFDWGEDAPDESAGKDNFSIRWTGLLRINAPGRHELVVLANTGARLWLDGRLVLDEPNLSRLRNGARVPVNFPAGLHTLKLEYWDTSGTARMKLHWRPPGATKDQPIPASAFYHEGSVGER